MATCYCCKIRDARPADAPFLARCIAAGMHFYDFEEESSGAAVHAGLDDIIRRLTECEMRDDLLYSYCRTRVAEADGMAVGSLLSYPGDIYREMRHKTFREIWPDLALMDATSEVETDPGEYYLDTLAVLPAYRRKGIGLTLLRDGISRGIGMGYDRIALAADSDCPHLIRLYESAGFFPADHRRAFGVDFLRMVYN